MSQNTLPRNSAEKSGVFARLRDRQDSRKEKAMGLDQYLDMCRTDKSAYMLMFGRLLKAFGEPEYIDTAKDSLLGPAYENKVIRRYPAFKEFYGGEKDGGFDVVTQIAEHLEDAERGGAARKKIMMLKGPVSGGKSTLAEIIKRLAEKEPYYVLRAKHGPMAGKKSDANDSPLCLFNESDETISIMQEEYGIPARYFRARPSSWVQQRTEEYKLIKAQELNIDPEEVDADPSEIFDVVRVFPSMDAQRGIASVTAGTANNQDEGDFVGRTDINKLGLDPSYSESHPDVYNYRAAALIRGHQGIVELVEILKLENPKALTCMLTATEEGMFSGVNGIGRFPSDSLILAHLNDSEYARFSANADNAAFISRTNLITVPYTLRVSEERKILEKYLREGDYKDCKISPKTLDLLAEFSVLTRLKTPPGIDGNTKPDEAEALMAAKLRVYNGENLKETVPKSKTIFEYRAHARTQDGPKEGMTGIDRRIVFDSLSAAFNHNASRDGETTADPVHLIAVLKDSITHSDKIATEDLRKKYLALVEGYVKKEYLRYINKTIRAAALDTSAGYAQSKFEQYIDWARAWTKGKDYIDPDTQEPVPFEELHKKMQDEVEKPGDIRNHEKFRPALVNFALEYRLENNNHMPDWTSSQIFKDAMEKIVFSQLSDLAEITSFGKKKTAEAEEEHRGFVKRMMGEGRSAKMVQREVKWWKDNKHTL